MPNLNENGVQASLFEQARQLSAIEQSVALSLDSIRSARTRLGRPLTGLDETMVALAMSLAQNIALGNAKGRAIANEAAQLRETMAALEGEDGAAQVADLSGLPEEVQAFIGAMGQVPGTRATAHGDQA